MVRSPSMDRSEPETATVLDALGDDATRGILETLYEPMTASELSEQCDIPLSTMYRKLDRLAEASLVEETTEIKRNGQHTTKYVRNFEAISIELADDVLSTEIERPEGQRGADQRLEELWSQIREET
ncbi:MAG: ArsR/SmtB family transcription factor [Halobacteriota archaeon]